jgi:hypothetical protein
MKLFNTLLSLAPTPLFFAGGVVSWLGGDSICSTALFGHHEMAWMWWAMSFAHANSWLMWYQQRRYMAYRHLPDKQQ